MSFNVLGKDSLQICISLVSLAAQDDDLLCMTRSSTLQGVALMSDALSEL